MQFVASVLDTFPLGVKAAYDFSKAVYLGASARIEGVLCVQHGTFSQYPQRFRKGFGCPQCGIELRASKKRMPLKTFLARACAAHGNRYSYDAVQYKSAFCKVQIGCAIHGEFLQAPQKHIEGQGCPVCAEKTRGVRISGVNVGALAAKTSKQKHAALFVEVAQRVHAGRYTYENAVYSGRKKELEITCAIHGAFFQRPEKHIYEAQGCPACGQALAIAQCVSRKVPYSKWEARAKEIHGDAYTYTYSESTYSMISEHVQVWCNKHASFFTTMAAAHVSTRAVGCPRCAHQLSKQEDAIHHFLSIFTPALQRDRTLIKPKELDILLPAHNLAVEYAGMYWHSHFDAASEKQDKDKHFDKYEACKAVGVRLLTIYESEWLERPKSLKRLLRNAIGKSRGKLMARKCQLQKVASPEARAFYEKYHPQGGAGAGEHYGLYHDGKLVACMRFNYGGNDRGHGAKERTWTLGRYATRVTVAGAASRLFKAFLAEYNPKEVKSFSDNRYFGGGMYVQLGFVLEEEVAPDYQVWSPRVGLKPKPHYQRRQLRKRQIEHDVTPDFDAETDPRTEKEVTYALGCGRIYDCGKKRWVWYCNPPKLVL